MEGESDQQRWAGLEKGIVIKVVPDPGFTEACEMILQLEIECRCNVQALGHYELFRMGDRI